MKSKLFTQARAAAARHRLRQQSKKVVFTNGCFDIIHAGHASFLDAAKKFGDYLIVGLNRDKSVRRLKGKGRPIMPFSDRALLLSYLEPVDMVVGFSDATPLRLINLLRPDVLVKGADYRLDEIVGAAEVIRWGGRIERVPLVRGKSTSKLLRQLRA
jgi:D-beta-D-heptose 7-phosphate kinase/D-beta-D-heptose 1-phosphate adenosyltransferase